MGTDGERKREDKKIYITGEEGTQVIPSESLKAQTVLRLNGAQDKEEL